MSPKARPPFDPTAPALLNGPPMYVEHRRGPFLLAHHRRECPCSYCHHREWDAPFSFGFLAPTDKAPNAWRLVFWVTASGRHYLRWTAFWRPRGAIHRAKGCTS